MDIRILFVKFSYMYKYPMFFFFQEYCCSHNCRKENLSPIFNTYTIPEKSSSMFKNQDSDDNRAFLHF